MQKIVLEMERLRDPNSGLGQYCLQLGRALAGQPAAQPVHFECYLPGHLTGIFGAGFDYKACSKWHKLSGINTDADLWHCMHQDSAYFPKGKQSALVITIHDLNFLKRSDYSNWQKKIKLRRLQQKINQAKGLVYISAFVKKDVHEHLHVPTTVTEKVIYNGVPVAEIGTVVKKIAAPYLFSIGLHPKKNYGAALPILKSNPGYQWIIAGADSKGYKAALEKSALELGVSGQLVFTGTVTEAEKWQLYQQCSAFIFPSLSEGFGLPVLEAMACGKPVFLAYLTSLPEIGGKEAFYFDNFDPAHMQEVFTEGMRAYSKDADKPNRLKAHAASFNWNNAAKDYLAFYQSISKS